MIPFKLDFKDFNCLNTEYSIIPISNNNIEQSYTLINNSIEHFNAEIEWRGMFNFGEAMNRIKSGMTMYVGVMDETIFGYVWFKDYKDGRFLFNLFVRNKVNSKPYTGKEFVSDVINRYEYDKVIHCEVDEWNEKSIRLFKRIGFK